jgi:hypothetical protein
VSIWYAERFNGDGVTPVFQMPGAGGFNDFRSGNAWPVDPDAASTVLVKTRASGDPDAVQPAGALVFSAGLDELDFTGSRAFRARFDRVVVPGGGTAVISTTYEMRASLGDLSAPVALDEDRYTQPTVKIATPVPGAGQKTQADNVTVRGTAVGGHTLALTVNGATVPIATDGTFETPEPVVAGENKFTAVLTNGAGNTDTASSNIFKTTPEVTPTPTPDTKPPGVKLTGVPKKVKRGKPIKGVARCNESCSLAIQLLGTDAGADLILARSSHAKFTLAPKRKPLARVGVKLRVVVVAMDRSGNRTTVHRTVTAAECGRPRRHHRKAGSTRTC